MDWIEQVRRRPGMYVGSTDSRGIDEMVREVVSNSVDLALVGAVTELRVRVEQDGGFTVTDDGPGIDVTPGVDGVPFLTRVATTPQDTPDRGRASAARASCLRRRPAGGVCLE
ncbi:ATP-binding protein [Kribbella sp. NPDC056861]|uniref:ATP-binding protein n=1 Tax=Kribbella sp. NPDC056861 TaxID=3154857 RepID=UPI0034172348